MLADNENDIKRVKVEFIESYIKIGNGNYQWNDNHGELIRCKDCWKREFDNCPFHEHLDYQPEDDFFCAKGEREEH